jgi:hypothetical protein
MVPFIGFENSKSEDFFSSFDDVKGSQSEGGDGFDAAAMSSAWGDPVASSEPYSADDQEFENGFDEEVEGDESKKAQDPDQRRPSRRRQPGARQGRSNRGGVEVGMDAMKICDTENAGGEREGRRDRRGEDPRKRSSSRSKRKVRGQRDGRPEKS